MTAGNYTSEALRLRYPALKLDDLKKHADVGVMGQIDGYVNMSRETFKPAFVSNPETQSPE